MLAGVRRIFLVQCLLCGCSSSDSAGESAAQQRPVGPAMASEDAGTGSVPIVQRTAAEDQVIRVAIADANPEVFRMRDVCASDALGVPLRSPALGAVSYAVKPVLMYVPPGAASLAIGDVTGDGRADIVEASYTEPRLSVHVQTPTGMLSAPLPLELELDTIGVTAVLIDVDGDGLLDIVAAGVAAGGLSVFLSRGDGQFAEPARYDAPGFVPIVRDIDRDGLPDLVGDTGDALIVFERLTDGGLQHAPDVAFLDNHGTICVEDVTGDGTPDVIGLHRGEQSGFTVYPFEADAHGFKPSQRYRTAGVRGAGCAAADFNHDGRNDVVFANYEDATTLRTWLFEQDSRGQLQDPRLIDGQDGSQIMAAGDLNGDARADLARVHGRQLSVQLQTDDGLSEPTYYDYPVMADEGWLVTLGDVNCDGCPDIVSNDVQGLVIFYGSGCAP
jgi:hypothetical protein